MKTKREFKLLQKITSLFQNKGTISQILQEITLSLPIGWHYPEIAAARINYDGMEYTTPNFSPSKWMQNTEFSVGDKHGFIDVVYLKEKPAKYEGPFLFEERWLINYLANLLKIYLEYRETTEALLKSEQNLKLLTTNVPAIIFQGYVDWSVDLFDNKVEEITGYTKEDFNSRKLRWSDLVIEDDIKGAKEVFIQALRTKTAYVREYRIRNKQGGIQWIQERSYIVLNNEGRVEYVSGIFFDISDRKNAEEELRKYRDRLEELVENRTYELILANEKLQWEISERKHAEEALLKAHDDLERRVEERTEDLRQLTIELKREIEERILAEKALRESREELQFLASELITIQESERRRISRELHDELGQALAVSKARLEAIEGKLRRDQQALKQDCENLLSYLDEITENVHRLSWDLSPVVLEVMGLSSSLENLFSDYSEPYGINCAVEIDNIDDLFPKQSQINIYRILQECLTNIIRHSQGGHFSVAIKKQDDHVSLTVQDNGRGFNVKKVLTRRVGRRGIGLAAMQERVRMLGGRLDIWSREGSGTRITCNIPIGVTNHPGKHLGEVHEH